MRTPPVVPPPNNGVPDPEPSWVERQDFEGYAALRAAGGTALAFVLSLVFGLGAAHIRGLAGGAALLLALSLAPVLTAGAAIFIHRFISGRAALAQAVTLPSGSSTPYEEQYSYQESLGARGDVVGALASSWFAIAERPSAVLPRLRSAEICASGARDPLRAAELFKSVRDTCPA